MDTSNFKEVFTSDEVKRLRQRVAELEQQLTEVRRAEREKVIEKCIELGAIAHDGGFAEELRAME